MSFYRLKDDVRYSNRWYLGEVVGFDNWDLLKSPPEDSVALEIELFRDGDEMDFTLSECYGVPVVSEKIKEQLEVCSGVNFVPIRIKGKKCNSKYYALVVPSVIECVDEGRSSFQKFEVNDPVRPDKAGEYRAFTTLRLDSKKIKGIDFFRVKGFEVAIIVSENIKSKLDRISATGLSYSLVI